MNTAPTARRLDRHTQFAELASVARLFVSRSIPGFACLVVALIAYLFFTENPGWLSLLWLGIGMLIALVIWRDKGVGLPLVPILAAQHFATYAIPVISNNATLAPYPASFINQAGFEVFLFMVTMTAAWRLGMEFFQVRASSSYALKAFNTENLTKHTRIGVSLIVGITAYNILDAFQLIWPILSVLPNGTYSIISAMVKAVTMAGYFLVAMHVGTGQAGPSVKGLFWSTFAVNTLIVGSSLLLSSATNIMAAVVVGLFWGGGRMPWKFITVMALIMSFLHLGKFEMRERYWDMETESMQTGITSLPGHYAEWIGASYDNLVGASPQEQAKFGPQELETSSMVDRVNNLQNLLFAINAVEARNLPLLGGTTYTLIPPLLIPRIFWPDKPRAHEGQVMLNVHFERQSLSASFKTYVAWGLLAEAYGNFGAFWGAILLGLFLGLLFARIETSTARKPLLSLEGLVTFAFFIELTVSFEMVASVLTTALLQSVIVITLACAPFVHRTFANIASGDPGDPS